MAVSSSASDCFTTGGISDIDIVIFNMHGFNQCILQLQSFKDDDTYSVIFLQEHWKNPDQLSEFNYFNDKYEVISNSAMTHVLQTGILRGGSFVVGVLVVWLH